MLGTIRAAHPLACYMHRRCPVTSTIEHETYMLNLSFPFRLSIEEGSHHTAVLN